MVETWDYPPAQGLYDPANETAACGVGFIVHIDGVASSKVGISMVLLPSSLLLVSHCLGRGYHECYIFLLSYIICAILIYCYVLLDDGKLVSINISNTFGQRCQYEYVLQVENMREAVVRIIMVKTRVDIQNRISHIEKNCQKIYRLKISAF